MSACAGVGGAVVSPDDHRFQLLLISGSFAGFVWRLHNTEPIMIMIVMTRGKHDILLWHGPVIIVQDKRNFLTFTEAAM